MQRVQLKMAVPVIDIDQVFDRLCDFDTYPKLCPAVRSVNVKSAGANEVHSDWEVNFNNGILKWSEHDTFHRERREINFRQTAGDIDRFEGRWQVSEGQGRVWISFDAAFDLGLPMLEDMLNPIAEKTIRENIRSIITGLFLDSAELETIA